MNVKNFLFLLFSILVLIKLILSATINSPHIVLDESLYFIEASNIWNYHSYFMHGYGAQYPPLYPLLISAVGYFNSTITGFKVVLIINAFISSTIIFPSYYLAREWLSEHKSFVIAVLAGIMPASFIYSFTAMSENLFFTLFLCSVLFMKKVLNEDSFKNNALVGVFISLTVLTKLTGLILIGTYVVVKGYVYFKNKHKLCLCIK